MLLLAACSQKGIEWKTLQEMLKITMESMESEEIVWICFPIDEIQRRREQKSENRYSPVNEQFNPARQGLEK